MAALVITPSCFKGPSLLRFIEIVPVHHCAQGAAFRFPVQRANRPDQNFRAYNGQVISDTFRPCDGILEPLPSAWRRRVKSIETFNGDWKKRRPADPENASPNAPICLLYPIYGFWIE